MAFRRRPGTRSVVSELNPPAFSTAPEGGEKLSGDGDDPALEEAEHDKLDCQTPSPTPARYSLSDGSGDDSIRGESSLQPDSMEEDSLSEYDNVGSGDEEEEVERGYEEDEELQTEADRMTYYVHCCPEDESYMEGMDCHEGADGAECPSTSRDVRESCKPKEHSDTGLCTSQQKDAMVYKQPEPITETTFVQAPMAEDEEDEEETEEDVEEEDSEEEDNGGFFHYEGNEAELNNNEIPHKDNCSDVCPRDGRSHPQEFSRVKVGQESRQSQDNPKYSINVPLGSNCTPRDRKERVRDESASDCPKVSDAPVARESRKDSRQNFKYRGHHLETVNNRETAYQEHSRVTIKGKSAEDRGTWRKRHLLKYSREDGRSGDGNNSHKQSKSPENSKNRAQDHPICSHKSKGGKERKSFGDVEEARIENDVKTKLVIAPNNSGRTKVAPDQAKNGKGAPESPRASSASSGKRNSKPRAHANTPVQSPAKQVNKDSAKPVEEEKTRPNEEQVTLKMYC